MNKELLGAPPLDQSNVARVLAEQGEASNREHASRFSQLRKQYPDLPIFNLAVVDWLEEVFPVKKEESLDRNLLAYMEEDTEQSVIDPYAQIPLFVEAATLWRIVLITQDASSITDDFSATDIWIYQEIVLNAAGLLGIRKIPKGIGPWLFLGPFKLLAAWKPQYWGSMEFEHLLYPIGKEEVSALGFLKEQRADWLGNNLERILKIEEQSFSTASATITLAQDIQKGLAKIAGTHLLQINAGLRELGTSL
ncbi:MAG: hypothetical protein ACE5I0_05635 [Candidatus Binatia bacterium]